MAPIGSVAGRSFASATDCQKKSVLVKLLSLAYIANILLIVITLPDPDLLCNYFETWNHHMGYAVCEIANNHNACFIL